MDWQFGPDRSRAMSDELREFAGSNREADELAQLAAALHELSADHDDADRSEGLDRDAIWHEVLTLLEEA